MDDFFDQAARALVVEQHGAARGFDLHIDGDVVVLHLRTCGRDQYFALVPPEAEALAVTLHTAATR